MDTNAEMFAKSGNPWDGPKVREELRAAPYDREFALDRYMRGPFRPRSCAPRKTRKLGPESHDTFRKIYKHHAEIARLCREAEG